jgi:hypothetical protein
MILSLCSVILQKHSQDGQLKKEKN